MSNAGSSQRTATRVQWGRTETDKSESGDGRNRRKKYQPRQRLVSTFLVTLTSSWQPIRKEPCVSMVTPCSSNDGEDKGAGKGIHFGLFVKHNPFHFSSSTHLFQKVAVIRVLMTFFSCGKLKIGSIDRAKWFLFTYKFRFYMLQLYFSNVHKIATIF